MDLAARGLAAQQLGDTATAIALYSQSLALQPGNPDALHMLGVAHMQQFEPEKALSLIEQAADLTGWRIAMMRHNYGWALSVFMSARPPGNLQARAAAVAQIRRARIAERGVIHPRVAVLAICTTARQAGVWMAQLSEQTQPPSVTAILLPEDESLAFSANASTLSHGLITHIFPLRPVDPASLIGDVLDTLDADYVQLLRDPVTFAPTRLQQMAAALEQSGAVWGFSKASLDKSIAASALPDPPMLDALNGLSRLQHRLRLGDTLLERPQLPLTISNLIFERVFLFDVLRDSLAATPTALALSLAAVWHSEPLFVDAHTFSIDRATLAALDHERSSESSQQMMLDFVQRIIGPAPAPNPLAPHANADGIDVLKRALRGGLGSRFNQHQLQHVAQSIRASRSDSARTLTERGIEFIGFARAESGLGENLRSLVRAATTTELASCISASDVDIDSGIRNSDTSIDTYMDGRMFRTRVICVNPDVLGEAFHHDGFGRFPDAYRIGFWFWELERIPRMWVKHAHLIDEIWVATDFVADAVRRDVRDRPVIKIRTPVMTPRIDRVYSRSEFGLRDDCCLFMFSFAYGSFATRKNPEATIRAFRLAFPLGTEAVQLVIKTSQSELFTASRDALVALAANDPRITFINSYLSRHQLIGLQSVIDCYVSLHRSEGLGLGLAECMAQGKPAIATRYSGNLEFMNDQNSLLVDYTLIPVAEGEYPDFEGQVWADASVSHAADQMRSVFLDPPRAEQLGRAGAAYLAEHFSYEAIGRAILSRYAAIEQKR